MTGGCERGTITFDSSSQSASSAPSALGLAGYAIALREQGGGRGDEYSRHYMQSERMCAHSGEMSRTGYVGFGAPYVDLCVSRLSVERCGGGRRLLRYLALQLQL